MLPDSKRTGNVDIPTGLMPGQEVSPARKKRIVQRKKVNILRTVIAVMAVLFLITGGVLIISNARLVRLREMRASAVVNIQKYNKGTEKQKTWIREYALANRVNPAFIAAIIYCESTYDPNAVSGAGARGLMQIMEGTASWLAGKLGDQALSFDDMFDPETNIRYGVWYIAYLSDIFGGDPVKIASAYHAGKDNVKLWIMNHTMDGTTLTADDIPMEDTRDYVRKVLDVYAIYLRNYYQDDA